MKHGSRKRKEWRQQHMRFLWPHTFLTKKQACIASELSPLANDLRAYRGCSPHYPHYQAEIIDTGHGCLFLLSQNSPPPTHTPLSNVHRKGDVGSSQLNSGNHNSDPAPQTNPCLTQNFHPHPSRLKLVGESREAEKHR